MPQALAPRRDVAGRIDRHDHAREIRRGGHAALLRSACAATARRRGPRSVRRRSPGGRAACRHNAPPRWRGIPATRLPALTIVPARVTARRRIGHQPLDQRDRPRRGGDHLARIAVQAAARTAACRTPFSASRHLAISSHQAAWNCGPRKLSGSSAENACGNAAVAPFEPAAARNPFGPRATRMHREQSGDAFDHHLAHLVLALADQRDALPRRSGERAHPFGAGARLAGAAPADDEPGHPRRTVGSEFGRLLVAVREHRPVGLERVTLLPAQRRHERRCLARRQKRQFFAQVRNGIRRCRQGCHRPRAPRIGSAGC